MSNWFPLLGAIVIGLLLTMLGTQCATVQCFNDYTWSRK